MATIIKVLKQAYIKLINWLKLSMEILELWPLLCENLLNTCLRRRHNNVDYLWLSNDVPLSWYY